jgi:hypothetical protein
VLVLASCLRTGAVAAEPVDFARGSERGALVWLRGIGLHGPARPDQRLLGAQVRVFAEDGAGGLMSPRWVLHGEGELWHARRDESWQWLEPALSDRGWSGPRPRRRSRSAATAALDWAYVQGRGAGLEYSVGRQPISRGLGRLWSVLDLHVPFLATDIERLYKPGVDAVLLDYSLGGALTSQSLVSLRHEPGQGRSSHWQQGISWQHPQGRGQAWFAGRSGQRLVGLGFQRLDWLGGGDWYSELLLHRDEHAAAPDRGHRWLVGAQYRLGPKHLLNVEYLRQSQPEARALPMLGSGTRYLAAAINWEIHPLVTFDAIVLRNGTDGGMQGLLSTRWQAREDIELRVIFSAPLHGAASSEYRQAGRALQLSLLKYF